MTRRYAIYETRAHGRGNPVAVFDDRDAAEEYRVRLTRETGVDLEILPIGYDVGTIDPGGIELHAPDAA